MQNVLALNPYRAAPGIDVSPVAGALQNVLAQNNKNTEFGFQQQASDRADQELGIRKQEASDAAATAKLQHQADLARVYGGWAQSVQSMPDDAQASASKAILASHPEMSGALTGAGIDPNDHKAVLGFLTSTARGYRDPLDTEIKTAQLANEKSEAALRGKSWGTTGHDLYGNPTYGEVDLTKPNGGVVAAAPGAPDAADEFAGLKGDDLLAKLPGGPNSAAALTVKKLAHGDMQFPAGPALKTPYWQRMLGLVSQYDPSFNQGDYGTRYKTRQDFASGATSKNITSLNTAIGHLGHLDEAVTGMNNSDFLPSIINPLVNAVEGQFSGKLQASKAQLRDTAAAVAGELAKVFTGKPGTLSEIKGYEDSFSQNQSDASMRSSLKQFVRLMGSRLEELGAQWDRGMNTSGSDPMTLLSPDKRQIWERIAGGNAPDKVQGQAPVIPHVRTKAERDALPDGTRYIAPNGRDAIKGQDGG